VKACWDLATLTLIPVARQENWRVIACDMCRNFASLLFPQMSSTANFLAQAGGGGRFRPLQTFFERPAVIFRRLGFAFSCESKF
jgi:hypothetical protein